MSELLPCPFCEGKAYTIKPARYGKSWGVLCECGAFLGYEYTEAEVIAAWNTRSAGTATEQAIAATLGRPKAKAHPYGYEPDTGAFDCTRCECGCINDISATYCNDCGGEIEIDMYAEKEIYHTQRHLVFAEKHDDGSIEFGGKRYVAATLGDSRAERTCKPIIEQWDDPTKYDAYCGNCNYPLGDGELEPWNYCPNCGCKVVGE